MLLLLLLLLCALQSSLALQAECDLRLHGSKRKIGTALFSSSGHEQLIKVNVEGPTETFTEGTWNMNLHTNKIKRQDCNTAGSYYEPANGILRGEQVPDKMDVSDHLGMSMMNLRFGERGEANLRHTITIYPDIISEGVGGLVEAPFMCPPEHWAIWSNGKETLITDMSKAQKKKAKLDKKGGKTFVIVSREPDCYNPVHNMFDWSIRAARFKVEGKGGVAGRSLVIDGNEGPAACCTLKLVKD